MIKNIKYRNFKSSNAFTLIELLVSIGIIAVLASISIALYEEYRATAYDAQALAAARNGAFEMEVYITENDVLIEDNRLVCIGRSECMAALPGLQVSPDIGFKISTLMEGSPPNQVIYVIKACHYKAIRTATVLDYSDGSGRIVKSFHYISAITPDVIMTANAGGDSINGNIETGSTGPSYCQELTT